MKRDRAGHARIFDVQRFCLHDGPGIRTVVFFKGCSLGCSWCQNPESKRRSFEMAFYADRCAGCLECRRVCEQGAIIAEGNGRIDRSKCDACGKCADICPQEALRKIGRDESTSQLLDQIALDGSYFSATGGGVTLSGGEPLLQPEAAAELLAGCRRAGINTTVETCGAVKWDAFELARPYTDLFFFDLKAGDEEQHHQLVGTEISRIFGNAERLIETGARVEFRMAVVPGQNDGQMSLDGIAGFLEKQRSNTISLLPYHSGGIAKIDRIGSNQPKLAISRAEADQALARAAEFFTARGLTVSIASAQTDGTGDARPSTFTERVWRLRRVVQSTPPAVCLERARLVTRYFVERKNRRKPVIVQKAEALRHVLRNRSAKIYDDELLVGNFSSKRVGGGLFPELHGVTFLEDLLSIEKRPVNPLRMEAAEKWEFLLRIVPFWLTRFLALKAFPLPRATRFIRDQILSRRYVINETGGISHFVPDYATLLRLGTSGIRANASALFAKTKHDSARDFYQAVDIVCQGLEDMARQFAELARRLASECAEAGRRAELEEIARSCERVPRLKAETLREALQSILFAQIAMNLESLDNAISPGRLDFILDPYYRADKAAGRIDERAARELIGCFTVKMSEIVPVFSGRITRIHGGMFNGQVVVVGGVDREGRDSTNELTWMFLDAMDELRMRQPNYHARVHADSPPEYLDRVARALQGGSGAPSLMNDDVVVPMLVGRGIGLPDARDYSPVGCVEPVACGLTFGSTDAALVNLALPLEWALGLKKDGSPPPEAAHFGSIGEVVEEFRRRTDYLVDLLVADLRAIERANARLHPTPLTSLLIGGCLESGVDSTAGGARYNASGVQAVGIADVADSLAAMEDVVFRRKLCTMVDLLGALRSDFDGAHTIRGWLQRAPKYGNDDPEADRYAGLVMRVFSDSLSRHENTRGGKYLAGFYSVTAHSAFGEVTGALPSGRAAGRPLANGLSPASGRDRLGPTASLNSAARLDLTSLARNGVNVNLLLERSLLAGDQGVAALTGLTRGYFANGGMQYQINVLDRAMLEKAAAEPNAYPWLLVRVSGYSAYFNDLSPGMKQEIIERTNHCAAR
ncbi:MAG: glycyl-radical enzyme activating protein [Acidobacteriota bacterium]